MNLVGSVVVIAILIFNLKQSVCETIACDYGGYAHKFYSDSCCRNKSYELGHNLREFAETCYAHPMPNGLPYKENHWEYYECVVNNTLAPRTLTVTTYFQMMTKNLPQPIQNSIMQAMRARKKLFIPAAYRAQLKYFWQLYFSTEMRECSKELLEKFKNQKDAYERVRQEYEPKLFCRPQATDESANFFRFTKYQFEQCMESQTQVLTPLFPPGENSPSNILSGANVICQLRATTAFPTETFYQTECNFLAMYHYFMPRFLSESNRLVFFQTFQKAMAKAGLELSEIDGETFKEFEKNFANGADMNTIESNARLLINLEAAKMIYAKVDEARRLICDHQWAK